MHAAKPFIGREIGRDQKRNEFRFTQPMLRATRRFHLQDEAAMRWIYLTVIIVFVAIVVIFSIQNRELVTMSFLGFSVRAPLALLAAIVYILGAVTGGTLFALLRRSIRASRA